MRTSVKAFAIAVFAAAVFGILMLSHAGTVRAASGCTTSSFSTIAFGSLDVYTMASAQSTGTVTGTCSGSITSQALTFDSGLHPTGGLRAVPCSSGCGSDVIEYYLCGSATCNAASNISNGGTFTISCSTTGVTCSGGGHITNYTITIYATPVTPVAGGVNDVSVGTYGSDTVSVTP